MKHRLTLLIILHLFISITNAAQYAAGDLAPRGKPDGQINVGDLVVLTRLVQGLETPTATELIVGDVGPLNSAPDGVLDIRDILILQQAIMGQVSLGSVTVIPTAPVLNSVSSSTTQNPYQITGTSTPGASVNIYINGNQQQQVISNQSDGTFSINVNLFDGTNVIHATETDGVDESPPSNIEQVVYNNTVSRTQGGSITSNTVWTPGVTPQQYTLTSPLTIAPGVSLILMPGTQVQLGGNTLTVDGSLILNAGSRIESSGYGSINVAGNITINGTASSSVVLTSSKSSPNYNNWQGIRVLDGGIVSIDYAEIYYASIGVDFLPGSGGSITNSKIKYNYDGIQATGNLTNAAKNPLPVVNYNSFDNVGTPGTKNYRTQSYANNGAVFLDATNNYWGSTTATTIVGRIFDYRSNPTNSPLVNIGNILTSEGGSASTTQVLKSFPPQTNMTLSGTIILGAALTIPTGQVLTITDNSVLQLGTQTLTVNGNLVLNAGSRIESSGYGSINVAGNITINGTASSSVVLTSSKSSPNYNNWQGIRVLDGGIVSIDYAEIYYASIGVDFLPGSGGSITNSKIKYNYDGIQATGNLTNAAKNPLPVVNYNSFDNVGTPGTKNYRTQSYANNGAVFLDATNNYWGSTTATTIVGRIFDYRSNPTNSPLVNIGNILTSEGGNVSSELLHSLLPSPNTTLNGNAVLGANLTINVGQTLILATNSVLQLGSNTLTVNGSLILNAGSRIESSAFSRIDVSGAITINGTFDNPVVLVSNSTGKSKWNGIQVNAGGTANINYAIIKNASYGVYLDNALGYITNSIFFDNQYAINLRGATSPLISSNIITGNTYGIRLDGTVNDPSPTITGNDIYSNSGNSLVLDSIESVLTINNNWWNATNTTTIRASISALNGSDQTVSVLLDNISTAANGVDIPQSYTFSGGYISPVTSIGTKDTASISTTLSSAANWVVEVRDNSNQLIRSYAGNGASVNGVWDGRDSAALVMPDGSYRFNVRINGRVVERSSQIIVDNTLPQSILDPTLLNAVLNNTNSPLSIIGTAKDTNFSNYILEVADGTAPAETGFRNLNSDVLPQNNSSIWNWQFANSNSMQAETRGIKTLRLRAFDLAGNSFSTTTQLTLNHSILLNVSSDVQQINPSNNESVNVDFYLTFPATVYLRFYPEQDATTSNMVAEVSQTFTTIGAKTLSWNGMRTGNTYLADEAYRFELTAVDATSSYIYSRANLFPTVGTCGSNVSKSVNAGQNKYVEITCSTSQPTRIMLVNNLITINNPVDSGVNKFVWDVRDANGKMNDKNFAMAAPYLSPLRKDSIIIKGNNPKVVGVGIAPNIEVIATPYLVLHSFEQVSKIVYQLDQDANVSIRLLKPCMNSDTNCAINHNDPAGIAIFDGLLSAKDASNQTINHSFEWRGYDFNATTIDANNILVNEEGYYTFSIKATSATSGLSTIYRGSIYLGN